MSRLEQQRFTISELAVKEKGVWKVTEQGRSDRGISVFIPQQSAEVNTFLG